MEGLTALIRDMLRSQAALDPSLPAATFQRLGNGFVCILIASLAVLRCLHSLFSLKSILFRQLFRNKPILFLLRRVMCGLLSELGAD